MAATEVLRRELDFEDVIGTGQTFRAPDRPYLCFADDLSFPRLTFSTEDLKEYALRSQARRRFYEDLGDAAQAQGVSLSAYAYAQGAHQKAPDTSGLLSPFHDEQVHSEGRGGRLSPSSGMPPMQRAWRRRQVSGSEGTRGPLRSRRLCSRHRTEGQVLLRP